MAPRYRILYQGQNAPARNLKLDDLNRDEQKVYAVLGAADRSLKIREIARRTFKLRPNRYKADYRARNALRRLVREHLIGHVGRGEYAAVGAISTKAALTLTERKQNLEAAPGHDLGTDTREAS